MVNGLVVDQVEIQQEVPGIYILEVQQYEYSLLYRCLENGLVVDQVEVCSIIPGIYIHTSTRSSKIRVSYSLVCSRGKK